MNAFDDFCKETDNLRELISKRRHAEQVATPVVAAQTIPCMEELRPLESTGKQVGLNLFGTRDDDFEYTGPTSDESLSIGDDSIMTTHDMLCCIMKRIVALEECYQKLVNHIVTTPSMQPVVPDETGPSKFKTPGASQELAQRLQNAACSGGSSEAQTRADDAELLQWAGPRPSASDLLDF
jgi:hypothetical protein